MPDGSLDDGPVADRKVILPSTMGFVRKELFGLARAARGKSLVFSKFYLQCADEKSRRPTIEEKATRLQSEARTAKLHAPVLQAGNAPAPERLMATGAAAHGGCWKSSLTTQAIRARTAVKRMQVTGRTKFSIAALPPWAVTGRIAVRLS